MGGHSARGVRMIARAEMLETIEIAEERARRESGRKLTTYFPDTGDFRRELYPKHLEFFKLGATKRERLFLAANRVGKTEGAGGFELACHLTGNYPKWWTGRRFDTAIQAYAAGDTRETVRDILQKKLLGKPGEYGTGLIPRDAIVRTSPGFIPDAVQAIWVKHVSGGISVVYFKSYDQGREAFQGTEPHVIWLDEEPPMAVYTECLVRTMTNDGMVYLTFTPLLGMSEVVLAFLPGGAIPEKQDGSKAVVSATWDDVPHLSAAAKKDLWDAIPPFQRDARSKGLPQLGAGLIYPVPESVFLCAPFEIPKHWPRSYGLDVGWNRTAAIWGADDPETDTEYWYSEHYQGEEVPAVHAAAIKARGHIPGAIDPASFGRGQKDGEKLIDIYRAQGLNLQPADNAVEAGLLHVWERLSTGRLKIFANLQNTLSEIRLYRRNEKGKVIKERDHAMDAGRYRSMTRRIARAPLPPKPKADPLSPHFGAGGGGWMG
jgi:phage terminase large subunit-like protein